MQQHRPLSSCLVFFFSGNFPIQNQDAAIASCSSFPLASIGSHAPAIEALREGAPRLKSFTETCKWSHVSRAARIESLVSPRGKAYTEQRQIKKHGKNILEDSVCRWHGTESCLVSRRITWKHWSQDMQLFYDESFWKFSMCVITINLSSGWSASIVLRFHQSLTQFSNPSKPTASAYVFECNVRWLRAGLRVVMQKSYGLASKTVSLEMRMPEYLPENFMRDVVSSTTVASMLCTCSFFEHLHMQVIRFINVCK